MIQTEETKMQTDIQTKKCSMCDRHIELSKFRIHDVMCHRQNYKCNVCGDIVNKQDKEMHDLEICGKINDVILEEESKIPDDEEIPLMQKMTSTEMNEANEQAIMRIMQEEADLNQREIDRIVAEEAQAQIQAEEANLPMTNYEKSKLKTQKLREQYGENTDNWPEGVRPADNSKNQQLLGGDDSEDYTNQDYEGNLFDQAEEFTSSDKKFGPQKIGQEKEYEQNLQSFGFKAVQGTSKQNEIKPDSQNVQQITGEYNNDQIDFQAQSEAEMIEEQMLKQIMEQSKSEI